MRKLGVIYLAAVLMLLIPLQALTPTVNAQIRVGALTLNIGENILYSAVIDAGNGYAYFGTVTSPGIVVKVRLSDFTRVGNLTLNPGENSLTSAVIDAGNGYAYFGTGTSPGRVVKVDLNTFTRVGNLTLNTGENALYSAVIDTVHGSAYFGTGTSPGIVVKVRLSDFTRVGNLTLNTGENNLYSAVIDTVFGSAYFGTGTSPGIVVKVRLSDFTRVGNLTLNPGENNLRSAVIDPGFTSEHEEKYSVGYFGTGTSPGRVVEVYLNTFTRVGNLTLNTGENNLYSAVIDTVRGYAYFGTDASPGIVVKVDLSPFTRVGSLSLNTGENSLHSAVIDAAHGYAYFGTYTSPGRVVKVWLGAVVADLAGFVSSATNSTLLVVGDLALNPTGHGKPSGVGYQQGRDTTPLGFVYGMMENVQDTMFDTNAAINATTGRPLSSVPQTLIFAIGGPDINGVTHYYEHTDVAADRAPVTWSEEGSNVIWRLRNGTVVVNVTQASTNVPPGSSDVFAIQIIRDADGRLVVLMYGERYTGTWAAAVYFKFVVYANISTYTDNYYIVRWTDVNGDFTPNIGDTFSIVAQGIP
jgi:hypothetical protein